MPSGTRSEQGFPEEIPLHGASFFFTKQGWGRDPRTRALRGSHSFVNRELTERAIIVILSFMLVTLGLVSFSTFDGAECRSSGAGWADLLADFPCDRKMSQR